MVWVISYLNSLILNLAGMEPRRITNAKMGLTSGNYSLHGMIKRYITHQAMLTY
jgi:hypothetical protein